ncbi:uncharacterized protein LOC124165308 [Ischnura elegans]|uniref:uncharacterized protein LOC124165308 n=1 Tax=Ischnura elegans TaxID=197161 RepID=UPI001ED89532|nr:uncharacterized protein LOC124165308 [Ischnura elegans]
MSGNLADKLRRWGLGEEVIKSFQEQRITEDLLEFIDDRTLELLIPLAGDRLRFRLKLRSELRKDTESASHISEVPATPLVDVKEGSHNKSNRICGSSKDISNCHSEEPRAEILVKKHFPQSGAAASKQNFEEELDLERLLSSSSEGNVVLGTFKAKGHLDKRARDLLAGRIIAHELRDNLDKRLSPDRLNYLANKIVELFPTESKGCWVSVDSRGVCETGKGKLYCKWYNTRRCHSKLGLIRGRNRGAKRSHDSIDQELGVKEYQEDDDFHQWLKGNAVPWVTVLEYWENTHQIRHSCLQKDENSIYDYMMEYPALRLDKGYMLLEKDFCLRFPQSSMSLNTLWPKLCNFILERVCVKGELKKALDDATSPDERTSLALLNFSRVFPSINAKKQTKYVKEWRPSKMEAQEAFVLHVENTEELETKLELRKDRLMKFGCQLPPVAAVVGPCWKEIQRSFSIIGPKFFEVETPLKAVDITFKAFHALNTQYPTEASQIWQFIQRAVFEIPRDPKCEPYFSSVETLLQDFSALKS